MSPAHILPGRLSPSQPHLSLHVRVSFTKNYFLFIPTHCVFTAWFPLSHSVLLFTASCCPQLYAPSGLDNTKHWQGDGEIVLSSMLVQPSEGQPSILKSSKPTSGYIPKEILPREHKEMYLRKFTDMLLWATKVSISKEWTSYMWYHICISQLDIYIFINRIMT